MKLKMQTVHLHEKFLRSRRNGVLIDARFNDFETMKKYIFSLNGKIVQNYI